MERRKLVWICSLLLGLDAGAGLCQIRSATKDSLSIKSETNASLADFKNDTLAYGRAMIKLAGIDFQEGRMLEAIRKTQALLILESAVRPPGIINFEILVNAANFYSSFDRRYGLQYYRKASDLISQVHGLNPSDIFSLYTTRAGAHAKLMELDTAMYYYYKSITAAQKDSPEAQGSSYNNLGVHFIKQAQYDSALVCFTRALQFLQGEHQNIMLYCATQDNIAQIRIKEGKYEEAYRTFQYNDSVYFHHENYRKALPNLIRLVTMMDHLGKPGIANVIDRGSTLIQNHLRELQAEDILLFYRQAESYYADKGIIDQSKVYREAYQRTSDSLDVAVSEQLHELTKSLLALQESNYTAEIKAKGLETEKARLKLRSTRRMLWISSVAAFSIVVLLILYFRKRRQELAMLARIAESELRNQQIEARLMEHELALKKKDITNIVLHNTQVYDLNQKMIDRLETISLQKQDQQQLLHSLLVELQQQNQIGDRAQALQANLESVNEAFYSALRARYPDITKSEAELCGYIRINLTSKDISVLKNVEAGSVKMAKNRLRKKLGITPEVDLYAFIQTI